MVKWTDHATTQLRHIYEYIAQDSPLYAKRVTDSLARKTLLLVEYLDWVVWYPRLTTKLSGNYRNIPIASSTRSKPHTLKSWPSFTSGGICRRRR